YEGTGAGIHTPVKQPADGRRLGVDNRTHNQLLRSLRGLGERAFALLTGRWYGLRHITASPRSTGDIIRAALMLTHFGTYPILVEITSLINPLAQPVVG